SEADLMMQAESLGGLVNAYTSTDHLCYHATTSSDLAMDALALLANYVVAPHLSQAVFDRELGVVQRELERDRDDPDTQLEELLNELVHPGHPLAAPVIGYRDRLITLRREDMAAFHARVHTGSNVVIVVVGDIDFDAMQATAARAFDGLPRGT